MPGPEGALEQAARVLRPGGWLAVFDGDYATTTVSVGPADSLQACADAWIGASVHDPWLIRRLPGLLQAAAALKAEARRRITAGQFFGHITYASLVATR